MRFFLFRVKHHWPWHPVWLKQVWPAGLVCIGAMSPTPIVIVCHRLSIHFVSFLFLYPKNGKENSVFFECTWLFPMKIHHLKKSCSQNTKHMFHHGKEWEWTNMKHPFSCLNSFRDSPVMTNRDLISDRMDPATGCIAFRRWRGLKKPHRWCNRL